MVLLGYGISYHMPQLYNRISTAFPILLSMVSRVVD